MSWINEIGVFDPTAEGMPDNVKSLIDSKGYAGVEDLATAYTNAASKLGVDPTRLLTLPDKPDDADGWSKLYTKMGRPESPDGYKPDVKTPDGLNLDDALMKEFANIGHSIGLTNSQLSKIVQFQMDSSAKYLADSTAAETKAQEVAQADKANAQAKVWDTLKVTHSVKTDEDMTALTAGAKETAEKIGLYEILEKHGLGDDPEVIGKLIALKSQLSESANLASVGAGSPGTKDEQLKAITSNPAFNNNMHPDHVKVMKDFQALYGIA